MAIFLTPLFCLKKLHGIKYLTLCMILSVLMIVFYLGIDLVNFKNHYKDSGELETHYWKSYNNNWITLSPIFISVFYIQSNILTVFSHLKNPTK